MSIIIKLDLVQATKERIAQLEQQGFNKVAIEDNKTIILTKAKTYIRD